MALARAGAAAGGAQVRVWAAAGRGGGPHRARLQAPPAAALHAVAVLQAAGAAHDAHPRHACRLHGERFLLSAMLDVFTL